MEDFSSKYDMEFSLVTLVSSVGNGGFGGDIDPDLCRNTMKYRNTHKHKDAAEIRLHLINNK